MSPLKIGAFDKAAHKIADPGTQKRASALKLAKQFEEMFVQNMVSALRKTSEVGGEDSGMFGSGPGSDTYAQWFDQNLAEQVSSSGRLGVTDLLMKDFERNGEIPPAPKVAKRMLPDALPKIDTATMRNGAIDVDA
ncbi:MAG: rod-binding protein [Planctomycetota bacterium]|jgi:Rod binding domain-containing protein